MLLHEKFLYVVRLMKLLRCCVFVTSLSTRMLIVAKLVWLKVVVTLIRLPIFRLCRTVICGWSLAVTTGVVMLLDGLKFGDTDKLGVLGLSMSVCLLLV